MAFPNIYYYNLAGQLRHFTDWMTPVTPAVVESHLAHVLKLDHLLIALDAPITVLEKVCLPILNLAHAIWREAKHRAEFKDIDVELPIWHNPMFFHLLHFIDYFFWKQKVLTL